MKHLPIFKGESWLFRCCKSLFITLSFLLFTAQALQAQQGACTSPPNFLVNGNFESPPVPISGNTAINNTLSGWFVSHGDPTLMSLPTRNMWMWSYFHYSGYQRGEGIFNCFNFRAGREYLICFDVLTNQRANADIILQATTGLTPYYGGGLSWDFAAANPTSQELIYSDAMVNYPVWTSVSTTYTPSQNFTELWVYPWLPTYPGSIGQAEMQIDNVVITEINPAAYTVSPDVTICNPGSTVLSATGGTSYNWSPATGLSCTNCPNPVASPAVTTTYTVEINDPNLRCPVTREVTVTVEDCGCNPEPNFDYSIDSCEVSFFGVNSGTAGSWFWDFGDGTTSTLQNPVHHYSGPGNYTVCLTIICDDGTSVTVCQDIVVTDCPCECDVNADFTYQEMDKCVYQFTGNATANQCTDILGIYWDFGDGNTATGANATHPYSASGIYTVCMTVVGFNGEGDCCTETKCYDIKVDCDPCPCYIKPDFSYVVNNDECTVDFKDLSKPNKCTQITGWSWDFGDGNTSTAQNPSHTYGASGVYLVCLTVTGTLADGTTCEYKICYQVKVDCKGCECHIDPDFSYLIDRCTVNFTDLSVPNSCTQITGWSWDFGDGNTSTAQNPTHTYGASGTYTVCLTVTGVTVDGTTCQYTLCYEIEVECDPCTCFITPDFSYFNVGDCSVEFKDLSVPDSCTQIFGWKWDFGDGGSSTAQNPVHMYPGPGGYVVCLTVFGTNGTDTCSYTICKDISVECNPCPCGIKPDFRFFIDGCKVQFRDISRPNSCTQITGWSWDFGDGNTSNLQNPSHTYGSNGTYTVCLTVFGTNGTTNCSYTICYQVTIKDCEGDCKCDVIPDFKFEIDRCTVQFIDNSLIGGADCQIIGWSWDFGDGTTSTLQNPSHTYGGPGSYTVCLIITYTDGTNICTDTICHQVDVEDCEPCQCDIIPEFDFHVDRCTVFFNDLSNSNCEIIAWDWDFGDGSSSSQQNPVHSYAGPGVYTVCLTITAFDGEKTCKQTICKDVPVEDCKPCDCPLILDIQAQVNGCDLIINDNTMVDPDYPCDLVDWQWDFGDGNTGNGPNVVHTYNFAGTYTVCVTHVTINHDTGEECSQTVCNEVTITDCEPSPFPAQKTKQSSGNTALPFEMSIFPNPTSGEVNVEFSTTEMTDVKLAVYNTAGKHVVTLLDNPELKAGHHSIQWSPASADVADGVYYIMIKTGEKVKYEKVVFKK